LSLLLQPFRSERSAWSKRTWIGPVPKPSKTGYIQTPPLGGTYGISLGSIAPLYILLWTVDSLLSVFFISMALPPCPYCSFPFQSHKALLDRLLRHAQIVQIAGESYRLWANITAGHTPIIPPFIFSEIV
jgi:hypothetical protein